MTSVFSKKLLDALITALACCLLLVGLAGKVQAFREGLWLNAGGAILFYLLQFAMFVFRRSSLDSLKRPFHYGFALAGTFLPLLLQVEPSLLGWLSWLGLWVEGTGMLFSLVALATLGRGFGIFAARREIKTHGLYRWIRHPLYTGEALWFFSLVLQNFSFFNLALFSVQTLVQVQRMKDEEALLSQDAAYAAYLDTVRFRMIPGVF